MTETTRLKPLSEEAALVELARLYRHAPDDSQQFTRWQMICAIEHGRNMERAKRQAKSKPWHSYQYHPGDYA
jgi:hypothetical protein